MFGTIKKVKENIREKIEIKNPRKGNKKKK